MESISLKLDKSILNEIDSNLKKHRYSTRTEFIRDAVRDKLIEMENRKLSDEEKKELFKAVDKARGILKTKTSDEDLRRAREKAGKIFIKKFNLE